MQKSYLYGNKITAFFMIFILLFSISGCRMKKTASKEKSLTLYVDVNDKHSLNILNLILDDYKKKNQDVKITVNGPVGNGIVNEITQKKDTDIVITSRNNMIELAKKGYLSELGDYYEKNNISDRYYNVISSYGRYSDKYFGIPLTAFSIEVLYNSDILKIDPNAVPLTLKDLKNVLKNMNSSSIRIPVVLTEDLDINNALAAFVASNSISLHTLGNIYDGGAIAYKSYKEMQNIFDTLSALVKEGVVNRNTFQLGSENSVTRFANGEIPLLVCISYYANNFKSTSIKAVSDYTLDSGAKGNIPIICNCIMCIPLGGKNKEQIESFTKYILSDNVQKLLSINGIIPADKKVNESLKGVPGVASWHLMNSGDNSIVYIYNVPLKFKEALYTKIETVLSGKDTKKEWEEIIEEIYKQ